jgi:glucoamylase
MHFYRHRRRFSPRLVQLTSGFIIILLLFAIFLAYFNSVHAVDTTASGAPGTPSFWTPSNNTFLGTAENTSSDVWFSGYNGVIGEVFYPTADMPNTTDLQFLVGDSGHTWVDEEKIATTSQTQLYNKHSLAWTVTNTAISGKYRIMKIIYTDPTRNSLVQPVTFTALSGHLSNYLLYALYNPTIHNAGNNNSSSTQIYNGTTMLVTTDSSANYASALAASFPFEAGMTSSGFVGVNDGWTDLKGSSNCGCSSCPDYAMNDAYSQADNGNIATPTKSMDPLNWTMGEFITLLMSAKNNDIADVPSLSFSRYVTNAYQPYTGKVADYDTSQLYQGKALSIFYNGSLT